MSYIIGPDGTEDPLFTMFVMNQEGEFDNDEDD